jgi:hypothetical protein
VDTISVQRLRGGFKDHGHVVQERERCVLTNRCLTREKKRMPSRLPEELRSESEDSSGFYSHDIN